MASREAVSACQTRMAIGHFQKSFTSEVLQRLAEWCREHKDRVSACYVPYPFLGPYVKVFVVAKRGRFDFELNDWLADLESELDETGAGWPTDILQIASGRREQLDTFFDPEQSIQVFDDGDGGPAPEEG